ncbi:hypothetical protein FRX31_004571 [Thalictrum thalictroides]|uniref:No apical meristem-associated C-terminal domain-containing protein n=1 Tax=Thalictrum thalictroides TaxID=46969 RepID=A0A7J6X7T7_THATH|nr:hypothetical protein FRX31_004571 [Thalictrum thalictroides]
MLKNYPKWAQPEKNQQDENSPLEHGTPIFLDYSQLEGTPQDGIRPGSEGRRSGRDATKAKRRLASEKDPMWEEIKNDNSKTHTFLEQQLIAFNNAHQARMDLEQQKLDHKHARKQQKMDMKAAAINAEILSKNLADMTPFNKEYWTNKKRAIVNSSIERPRTSRNLDFGADGSGGSNSGSQFSPNNFDAHNNNTQYVPRSENGVYFPDLNDINANNGGFEYQYGQWRQQ